VSECVTVYVIGIQNRGRGETEAHLEHMARQYHIYREFSNVLAFMSSPFSSPNTGEYYC